MAFKREVVVGPVFIFMNRENEDCPKEFVETGEFEGYT